MKAKEAGKKIADTLENYLDNDLYKDFTGSITFTINCNKGGVGNMSVETKSSLK